MSYEYSKVVYRQVHDTTPTEQSVLAALAFCHNGKTGRCDPSRTTIGEMTHFGKCAEGQTIPPDKRDWPIPPEQCSHFVSSGE